MPSRRTPEAPLRRVKGTVIRNGLKYLALECGHEVRVRVGVAGQVNVQHKVCPLCVRPKKAG